ncbi:hypothetical protein [Natronorarus salvus]|uniref:hypothetical protein n=1 Tax=Natronorarus salvus TaxID=3117733 RepID=UPI002F269776
MSFRFRTVLVGGARIAASRNGLVLMALFAAVQLFSMLLVYSAGQVYVPIGDGLVGAEGAPEPGEQLPFAVGAVATALATLLTSLLAIPVSIVAVRTFVGGERDRIPDPYVFRRIGRATLSALVADVVVFVLYAVAFALPFVPLYWLLGELTGLALVGVVLSMVLVGLVLAVFLVVSLLFVTYEIAVRDARALASLRDSWRLARGHRLRLFALAVVIWAMQAGITAPTLVLPGELLPTLAMVPLASLAAMIALAVYARAYVELRGDPTGLGERLNP